MTTKTKSVEERSKQQNYQRRHREQGLCAKCATPTGINRRTGKHYMLCPAHLKKVAEYQKKLMAERREQGID